MAEIKVKYRHLGKRALYLILLQKTQVSFIFLLIGLGIAFFHADTKDLSDTLSYVQIGFIALFFSSFFIGLLAGWIQYASYKFALDENAIKIEQGIITKKEIAIPYRQIQSVNIERRFLDRINGVSHLYILSGGEDDNKKDGSESEGILWLIDAKEAVALRDELMKRANVERVINVEAKY